MRSRLVNPVAGCGQLNTENDFSLSSLAPENLVSRDMFGRPVLHQLNLVLTHGLLLSSRSLWWCLSTIPSTVIGPVPSSYKVTQMRADGVLAAESPPTEGHYL